ncbi:MAG: DNA-binding response regulator [Acidobacteria bacterium]|nr:MAG: DNA-binding response regulator [Acidobacteriota bacterium]
MSRPTARILVIEDEVHLAEGIRENLAAEGYAAEVAHDGREGLQRILSEPWDLVLLDVMLPGIDGFTICERARAAERDCPILFLTAKGSVDDRIRGLEAGGDDYLPKPFHLKELLLRVRAIIRRRSWYEAMPSSGATLAFGGNTFDFRSFKGRSWDGREQTLTQKEAMILKALAEKEGEVVSREEILEKVWGYDLFPSTRTIDNFIVRLRKRFERDPENPVHFHTVRGVGYRFTREPEGRDDE